MVTNKLNFSAAGSNLGYKSGIGALSDRLMEFGSELNDQEQKKLLAKEREQDRRDKLNRYAIEDQRYLEQKAEKASDKFDARQKEIATNEALALVGDEKGFLSTKTSAENKAYEDALATVEDPVEKARLANEIKQYQTSGEQAKSWKDSVLGNSNIDQKAVGDLKRELDRDEESARRFNLQLAETRATRNEARAEREAARKREEQKQADVYGLKTIESGSLKSVPWGQYGALSGATDVKTGNKILEPGNVEAQNLQATLYEKNVSPIATKMENLNSKILTPEQKLDDKYLQEQFAKENPEAYKTSTPLGRFTSGIDTSIKKSSELRELYSELGNINVDPLNATPEQERLANEERKKIQSKINEVENKYSSTSSGSNISFEDYKKAKISESNQAEKEYNNLQSKLANTTKEIDKQIVDKFGIDEVKKQENYITSVQAGNIAAENAKNEARRLGLSAEAANYAISNAYQTAYNENERLKGLGQKVIQTATEKQQEKKEKSKEKEIEYLQDNIKSLNSLSEKFSGTKEDSVYYKGKEMDKEDAQKKIESEIEDLQRKLNTKNIELYPWMK